MLPSSLCRNLRFAAKLGVAPFMRRINLSRHTQIVSKLALIDFDKVLDNVTGIEENFASRKIPMEINLSLLKELYSTVKKFYRRQLSEAAEKRDNIEAVLGENYSSETTESNNSDNSSPECSDFYDFYRYFVLRYCLHLPNDLHERTPRVGDETIVVGNSENSNRNVHENHVQIGTRLGVLRYIDPSSYYLMKDAAMLERATIRYATNYLENVKFVPFCNPDTCNEYILPAIELENPDDVAFKLERELYLVGGASLALFCTYRVNTLVHKKFLPERFFTCARRYMPPKSCEENGLYTSCQRSNVHLFQAAYTYEDMMRLFDEVLKHAFDFYQSLGLDFRMHYVNASKLKLAESCRVCIQLYSPHRKDFVDVGYLSIYDDFVSKRLRLMCHDRDKNASFIHLTDGVFVDIPVLIACLLERSTDELSIPTCLQPYMKAHSAADVKSRATLP